MSSKSQNKRMQNRYPKRKSLEAIDKIQKVLVKVYQNEKQQFIDQLKSQFQQRTAVHKEQAIIIQQLLIKNRKIETQMRRKLLRDIVLIRMYNSKCRAFLMLKEHYQAIKQRKTYKNKLLQMRISQVQKLIDQPETTKEDDNTYGKQLFSMVVRQNIQQKLSEIQSIQKDRFNTWKNYSFTQRMKGVKNWDQNLNRLFNSINSPQLRLKQQCLQELMNIFQQEKYDDICYKRIITLCTRLRNKQTLMKAFKSMKQCNENNRRFIQILVSTLDDHLQFDLRSAFNRLNSKMEAQQHISGSSVIQSENKMMMRGSSQKSQMMETNEEQQVASQALWGPVKNSGNIVVETDQIDFAGPSEISDISQGQTQLLQANSLGGLRTNQGQNQNSTFNKIQSRTANLGHQSNENQTNIQDADQDLQNDANQISSQFYEASQIEITNSENLTQIQETEAVNKLQNEEGIINSEMNPYKRKTTKQQEVNALKGGQTLNGNKQKVLMTTAQVSSQRGSQMVEKKQQNQFNQIKNKTKVNQLSAMGEHKQRQSSSIAKRSKQGAKAPAGKLRSALSSLQNSSHNSQQNSVKNQDIVHTFMEGGDFHTYEVYMDDEESRYYQQVNGLQGEENENQVYSDKMTTQVDGTHQQLYQNTVKQIKNSDIGTNSKLNQHQVYEIQDQEMKTGGNESQTQQVIKAQQKGQNANQIYNIHETEEARILLALYLLMAMVLDTEICTQSLTMEQSNPDKTSKNAPFNESQFEREVAIEASQTYNKNLIDNISKQFTSIYQYESNIAQYSAQKYTEQMIKNVKQEFEEQIKIKGKEKLIQELTNDIIEKENKEREKSFYEKQMKLEKEEISKYDQQYTAFYISNLLENIQKQTLSQYEYEREIGQFSAERYIKSVIPRIQEEIKVSNLWKVQYDEISEYSQTEEIIHSQMKQDIKLDPHGQVPSLSAMVNINTEASGVDQQSFDVQSSQMITLPSKSAKQSEIIAQQHNIVADMTCEISSNQENIQLKENIKDRPIAEGELIQDQKENNYKMYQGLNQSEVVYANGELSCSIDSQPQGKKQEVSLEEIADKEASKFYSENVIRNQEATRNSEHQRNQEAAPHPANQHAQRPTTNIQEEIKTYTEIQKKIEQINETNNIYKLEEDNTIQNNEQNQNETILQSNKNSELENKQNQQEHSQESQSNNRSNSIAQSIEDEDDEEQSMEEESSEEESDEEGQQSESEIFEEEEQEEEEAEIDESSSSENQSKRSQEEQDESEKESEGIDREQACAQQYILNLFDRTFEELKYSYRERKDEEIRKAIQAIQKQDDQINQLKKAMQEISNKPPEKTFSQSPSKFSRFSTFEYMKPPARKQKSLRKTKKNQNFNSTFRSASSRNSNSFRASNILPISHFQDYLRKIKPMQENYDRRFKRTSTLKAQDLLNPRQSQISGQSFSKLPTARQNIEPRSSRISKIFINQSGLNSPKTNRSSVKKAKRKKKENSPGLVRKRKKKEKKTKIYQIYQQRVSVKSGTFESIDYLGNWQNKYKRNEMKRQSLIKNTNEQKRESRKSKIPQIKDLKDYIDDMTKPQQNKIQEKEQFMTNKRSSNGRDFNEVRFESPKERQTSESNANKQQTEQKSKSMRKSDKIPVDQVEQPDNQVAIKHLGQQKRIITSFEFTGKPNFDSAKRNYFEESLRLSLIKGQKLDIIDDSKESQISETSSTDQHHKDSKRNTQINNKSHSVSKRKKRIIPKQETGNNIKPSETRPLIPRLEMNKLMKQQDTIEEKKDN